MGHTIKAKFKLKKETKGAVMYQEVNDQGQPEEVYHAIGSLYVRKSAFPRGSSFPTDIAVTVEVTS